MAKKTLLLRDLAKITSTKLIGEGDHEISGVNSLERATAQEATFLANPRYEEAMRKSHAGVICLDEKKFPLEKGKNYLLSDDPSRTFQIIAELLLDSTQKKSFFSGVHPTAIVHESVVLGKGVIIAPYVVIEKDSMIGDDTLIFPFVYIGPRVSIGKECLLYSSSCIREDCSLGNRVILQPGAIIGSCGFGYTTDPKTKTHKKLQQLGRVIIEDDVEIGANTTIDRARFQDTRICQGTKIDNLVQIAHNVQIGEKNLIAAQTGIAGSSKTGKNVILGGQVGIIGHVEIGDNVIVATRGGVSKSLVASETYQGSPAIPLSEHQRQKVHVRKLENYSKILQELKRKVEELEKKIR